MQRRTDETWKQYAKRCEESRSYWMSLAMEAGEENRSLRNRHDRFCAPRSDAESALRAKIRKLQRQLAEIRKIASEGV